MVTAIFREINESSTKLHNTVAKSTRNYLLQGRPRQNGFFQSHISGS